MVWNEDETTSGGSLRGFYRIEDRLQPRISVVIRVRLGHQLTWPGA